MTASNILCKERDLWGGTGLSCVIHIFSPFRILSLLITGREASLKLGETSRKLEASMQFLLILGRNAQNRGHQTAQSVGHC